MLYVKGQEIDNYIVDIYRGALKLGSGESRCGTESLKNLKKSKKKEFQKEGERIPNRKSCNCFDCDAENLPQRPRRPSTFAWNSSTSE